MMIRSWAFLTLCLVLLVPMAYAATPSNGTISNQNSEVTWSGTPLAPNPAGCVNSTDPTCDHFILTVANNVKRVLIAITPAAGCGEPNPVDSGLPHDDYDLYVYDNNGVLLRKDGDQDGCESVIIENTGAAFYEVRVQPFAPDPGSSYNGVAMPTREVPVDPDPATDCLEAVPASISLPGILDAGERVELSVMLLLDGTDATAAQQVMARAAESYREWGIDLVLKKTKGVAFTSLLSDQLIADAKTAVGYVPPRGIDLVGVFTNKTMQAVTATGVGTVVGQADCIGGIRYDQHSFFVVSDIRASENPTTGNTGTLNSLGLNLNVDATAEVMAHEIGHLMGAHHHYANCVEGNLTSAGPSDVSPCTLMFNAVNGTSLNFGTLSGAVVRGHAYDYARP